MRQWRWRYPYLCITTKHGLVWRNPLEFVWMQMYKFSFFLNGTLNILPHVSKLQHSLHVKNSLTVLKVEFSVPIQNTFISNGSRNSCPLSRLIHCRNNPYELSQNCSRLTNAWNICYWKQTNSNQSIKNKLLFFCFICFTALFWIWIF